VIKLLDASRGKHMILVVLSDLGKGIFPLMRLIFKRVLKVYLMIPQHKGLARFRLFGVPYHFNHRDIAEFMNVPNSPDVVTKVQEDEFMDYELTNFWGSISGNPNSDPEDRFSTQIHNPAIRYFHMILAHTIFGKPVNDTAVAKEELFILFCASQGRPVNLATFMLANFVKIIENTNRRIYIGGFVTMLARAIGLHTPLDQLIKFGEPLASGFRYMNIPFCFYRSLIGTLGPASFQLVINHAPVHDFTLPNLERTNIHDKKNWLYALEKEDETDPETPPFYYTPGPLSPPHPTGSVTNPPPPVDHSTALANLDAKIDTLRADFDRFLDLVIEQFDRSSAKFTSIQNALINLRG
jgi:hypothetical protein